MVNLVGMSSGLLLILPSGTRIVAMDEFINHKGHEEHEEIIIIFLVASLRRSEKLKTAAPPRENFL